MRSTINITHLIIAIILLAPAVFPRFFFGGVLIDSVQLSVIIGLLYIAVRKWKRLKHVILNDYFSRGLIVITLFGSAFLFFNMEDVRDLNRTRFMFASPMLAYIFFYVASDRSSTRKFSLKVLCVSLLCGVLLNELLMLRPNLGIWAIFSGGKAFNNVDALLSLSGSSRFGGLVLADPIFSAIFFAIAAMQGFVLFTIYPSIRGRLLSFIYLVLCFHLILETQTRMVLISSLITLIYGAMFCVPLVRRKLKTLQSVCLILLVPLFLAIIRSSLSARSDISLLEGEATRIEAWTFSFETFTMSISSFSIGNGINYFYEKYDIWHSHNLWLTAAVSFGVPLSLYYIYIMFRKLIELYRLVSGRKFRTRRELLCRSDFALVYMAFLVMIIFMMESVIETSYMMVAQINTYLYALLGISSAIFDEMRTSQRHVICK